MICVAHHPPSPHPRGTERVKIGTAQDVRVFGTHPAPPQGVEQARRCRSRRLALAKPARFRPEMRYSFLCSPRIWSYGVRAGD